MPEQRRPGELRQGTRNLVGESSTVGPIRACMHPDRPAPPIALKVYVHVTVRPEEDDAVFFSTRGQEGGNGQPLALMIEKGLRGPRAWEIALKSGPCREEDTCTHSKPFIRPLSALPFFLVIHNPPPAHSAPLAHLCPHHPHTPAHAPPPPPCAGMKLKQLMVLKVKPSYGYEHPDCSMVAPPGVPPGEPLVFELQLVKWYSGFRTLPLNENYYRR
jgi:hypothetical protein